MEFEIAGAGDFLGEVFAGVEVFEEAGNGCDVVVKELDSAWLGANSDKHGSFVVAVWLINAVVLTAPSSNLSHISLKYGLLQSNA